jgi:FtsP/CotA-like multicopper oxidase with cupredoxin domain
MNSSIISRRKFVTGAGALAGIGIANANRFSFVLPLSSVFSAQDQRTVDYTLHIKASPIEIGPKRIISVITYNGQFPGPLLRFKEGRQVTVDIYNDTDTPEQLHWHGQKLPVDVDGAGEEGTPFIPAHGKRRVAFTPPQAPPWWPRSTWRQQTRLLPTVGSLK